MHKLKSKVEQQTIPENNCLNNFRQPANYQVLRTISAKYAN